MVYDDLPKELQGFFHASSNSIPSAIRHYWSESWPVITSKQRDDIVRKCRNERDSLNRVLIVNNELTKALLQAHPKDILSQ